MLAREVGCFSAAGCTQQFDCRQHPLAVLTRNTNLFIVLCADGQINCVKFIFQALKGDIFADAHTGMYLDTGGQNAVNVGVQHSLRQTVIGNAVAQHAAEFFQTVIDDNLMAHQR